ncbi:hypothetical protein [Telmatospirillum siberiense]|uniref:Lipoprotein n=1 Tax=Telmatospirillum siberiense TaxID=382514 RepID=A0A2N3Q155_9PROT|nr:hypothetical protein [Telmatospirillum siberiense]PKU26377.1 hypothetical protein CWS72_00555 [Telmatospirillum siberiense]
MYTRIIATTLSLIFVSACSTPGTSGSLAETVNSTPKNERSELLRKKCLSEADWDLNDASKKYTSREHQARDSMSTAETSHLRSLCREMADTLPATPDKSPHNLDSWKNSIREKCKNEIDEHSAKIGQDRIEHLNRYKEICNEIIKNTTASN